MADHRERDGLPAYALGLLDASERARIDEHLRGCAECSAELAHHRAIAAALSQELPVVRAPDQGWPNIAARIASRPPPRASFWRPRWPALPRALQPALLVVLAIAVLGLIGWDTSLQLSDRTTAARPAGRWDEAVFSLLDPTGGGGLHAYVVMTNDRQQGSVVASGLPAPAAGHVYQVWFVRPDQSRASAGTFQVDGLGQAVSVIALPQPVSAFDGVAISEEPASGSPSPTSRDLLAGPIYQEE